MTDATATAAMNAALGGMPASVMNPWMADMRRMKAPADSGPTISVGGFELPMDADGCVSVPSKFEPELVSHGFTRWAPPGAAKPAAKK